MMIIIPKLKPYVAINALLTIMIPTEVTTLNIHAAASTAAFLSALLVDGILYSFIFSLFVLQRVNIYPDRTIK